VDERRSGRLARLAGLFRIVAIVPLYPHAHGCNNRFVGPHLFNLLTNERTREIGRRSSNLAPACVSAVPGSTIGRSGRAGASFGATSESEDTSIGGGTTTWSESVEGALLVRPTS
jgi:hypothetical protein